MAMDSRNWFSSTRREPSRLPPMLSAAEAARHLGVASGLSMNQLMRHHKFPDDGRMEVGNRPGRYRYKKPALDAWWAALPEDVRARARARGG